MKKHGMKDHLNLFFSAFLVVAFMVCAYFFSNFTSSLPIMTMYPFVQKYFNQGVMIGALKG